MRDAFDSDVLSYAANGHPLGASVQALFDTTADVAGLGSLILIPELLSKPTRENAADELEALRFLLSRLDLKPVDTSIAGLAAKLGALHRLKAADAIHLATAVMAGADRFITNNRRDFPTTIPEIDIAYPDALAPA